MLHSKFPGNRSAGFREEDFQRVSYMGMAPILVMSSDFHFLVPENFHKKHDTHPQSSFCGNPVLIFVYTLPWAKVKK